MKTFKDIKYELYEKIDNLLNNGGKIIINVTNKEGTICYNSFLIESTIDKYHSYSYPKITNAKYSDTITPVYWGKRIWEYRGGNKRLLVASFRITFSKNNWI